MSVSLLDELLHDYRWWHRLWAFIRYLLSSDYRECLAREKDMLEHNLSDQRKVVAILSRKVVELREMVQLQGARLSIVLSKVAEGLKEDKKELE